MKEEYLILPRDIQGVAVSEYVLRSTAVILYLYYEETLHNYFHYIQNIPEEIDVYVYSSKENVCEMVQTFLDGVGKKNNFVFKKENRGRDVSALLVAAKDVFWKYKYICFIHDKKANDELLEEDTKEWIELLWENTLASRTYIENLLYRLSSEKSIGLLVPPKTVGKYNSVSTVNCWYKNKAGALDIAKKLDLKCDIDFNRSPISIGTVFWAKVKALQKLLKYNWRYEDFPEEPMPIDGTISHAIERMLSYVAADVGYETRIVMNDFQAKKRIERLQYVVQQTYCLLNAEVGITGLHSLEFFLNHKQVLLDFKEQGKRLYLYGAGKVGKSCLKTLKLIDYMPSGFIVSKKAEINSIENIPIYTFDEVCNKKNMKIIITVGFEYYKEIVQFLESHTIHDYIIWEIEEGLETT